MPFLSRMLKDSDIWFFNLLSLIHTYEADAAASEVNMGSSVFFFTFKSDSQRKMDELGDEDVVFLAAYILLKRSIRRKKDKKLEKRELFGKDRFTSKEKNLVYFTILCERRH